MKKISLVMVGLVCISSINAVDINLEKDSHRKMIRKKKRACVHQEEEVEVVEKIHTRTEDRCEPAVLPEEQEVIVYEELPTKRFECSRKVKARALLAAWVVMVTGCGIAGIIGLTQIKTGN